MFIGNIKFYSVFVQQQHPSTKRAKIYCTRSYAALPETEDELNHDFDLYLDHITMTATSNLIEDKLKNSISAAWLLLGLLKSVCNLTEMVAPCTDKKKTKFSSYIRKFRVEQLQKSYMRTGFLIYGEMRKYFPIFEESVSQVYDFATAPF